MDKVVKHALLIFRFLRNNYSMSELSDLEKADESFEMPKWSRFKIFGFV